MKLHLKDPINKRKITTLQEFPLWWCFTCSKLRPLSSKSASIKLQSESRQTWILEWWRWNSSSTKSKHQEAFFLFSFGLSSRSKAHCSTCRNFGDNSTGRPLFLLLGRKTTLERLWPKAWQWTTIVIWLLASGALMTWQNDVVLLTQECLGYGWTNSFQVLRLCCSTIKNVAHLWWIQGTCAHTILWKLFKSTRDFVHVSMSHQWHDETARCPNICCPQNAILGPGLQCSPFHQNYYVRHQCVWWHPADQKGI